MSNTKKKQRASACLGQRHRSSDPHPRTTGEDIETRDADKAPCGLALSQVATYASVQESFLAVLPAIQTHARIRFRHYPDEQREEAIAECVAAAYVNYAQLAQQRKLDQAFVTTLADYAARHVAQGRHVGGHQAGREALNPLVQRKHGFRVRSLSALLDDYGWKTLVVEAKRFSPAATAAFRVDFHEWMQGLARRERKIIRRMISGEGTTEVAGRFGLSKARISMLRREFERSWQVLQGEEVGQA